MSIKTAVHYSPGAAPGKSDCGLPAVPPERLTADLDAVTCGNCLSGLRWRNDMSQRLYKADYERFYGPGGFLDRAGQTTPASATTAPQARAAMDQRCAAELARIAGMVRAGAGDDVVSVAVRNSVHTIMTSVDALVRHAVKDRLAGPKPFRIRVTPASLATVDRPSGNMDPADEKVLDTLGNWWHLAPAAPAASCGNCAADLTWSYDTSAWARADEPERGRPICRYPDGTWKPHTATEGEVPRG